ncbi:MAG: SRPBCC family protein [Dehalococcoidia bacterium]
MGNVEQQITINAPAEKVFSYLADIPRHSEWARPEHKVEIKKTSDGAVGQGSTFQSVGHQFGKNQDALTITEYTPNTRLVFEADGNAGLIRHSFDLTPGDGGVQVTKSVEFVQTKFPFALFAPLAKAFVLPGALSGDLQRIKEHVEQPG